MFGKVDYVILISGRYNFTLLPSGFNPGPLNDP